MAKVVIAIDGPAGAGKSTVAKRLAQELGLFYLDTGAMYRALALASRAEGVAPEDAFGLANLLEKTEIAFGTGEPQPVLLDGRDVSAEIRSPAIGELASAISAHSPVRKAMVTRQQALVATGGVILEGRDATTVIAPHADLKVYLTASLEERARRRKLDFENLGLDAEYQNVRLQIENRDHRDITREDSPLKIAEGAELIDSANLSVEEVVARIKSKLGE